MFDKGFRAEKPVLLVGAGTAEISDIEEALAHAPHVVAADGGARLALAAGVTPDLVVGDFDSLDATLRKSLPAHVLYHVAEQDTTDFEKALSHIAAPAVLAVGFTGARIDHQLAAFSALLRFAHMPCVLLGDRDVVLHCPPRLALDLPKGALVSLFPLAPVTGRSTGLAWPIDGLTLAPGARIGTSNRASGGQVTIAPDDRGLLVILPRQMLDDVMRALLGSEPSLARWPAL